MSSTPDFARNDRAPSLYGEIDRLSIVMARKLRAFGVNKGDCVVTLMGSCADVTTCWFAINKLGAIWDRDAAGIQVRRRKQSTQ